MSAILALGLDEADALFTCEDSATHRAADSVEVAIPALAG